ncbi:MAG: hypothetical protein ACRECV_20875 [Xanthobacteraceae bacterium]
MHKRFTKRPLLRGVIALAAAYAIALSSLIASLSAVRAAVVDATSSGIVICQPTLLGQTAPAGPPRDCDSCCIGCPILLAAVPPAPTMAIAVERTSGKLLPVLAKHELPSNPEAISHQSRAPPLAA